jgi:hypothetical protein
MSKKQWRDWDGNLKCVAALYNQMTPRARQRLHAYLEEQTAQNPYIFNPSIVTPSSLVKTKLNHTKTNQQENDDGIHTV